MTSALPNNGFPSDWDPATILPQFDFSDTRSLSSEIIWMNVVFIVLLVVIVGLRLATRVFFVHHVFLDDVLILAATAFTLVISGTSIVAAKTASLGEHIWILYQTNPENLIPTLKRCIQYLYICYIFYACAIAFTKLSIICSFLRIFPHPKFRLAMHVTAVVVGGLFLSSVFAVVFQCKPVRAAWDVTVPNGECIDFNAFLVSSAALGLATDIVVTLVPIPLVWQLQVPQRQKIILSLLFCGGIVACVAAVVRLTTLHLFQGKADVTFLSTRGLNWSVIECALGIISVSIPALRPLLHQIAPKALLSGKIISRRDYATAGSVQLHSMPRDGAYSQAAIVKCTETIREEEEAGIYDQAAWPGKSSRHPVEAHEYKAWVTGGDRR